MGRYAYTTVVEEGQSFVVVSSTQQHRSCWDCAHINVDGGTSRYCGVDPNFSPWSGDALGEILDNPQAQGTVADRCASFLPDPRLEGKRLIYTTDCWYSEVPASENAFDPSHLTDSRYPIPPGK